MNNNEYADIKINSLADVIDRIDKPEEYLHGMHTNMRQYEKTHGKSCVKIGITGKGHSPNYRFEPVAPDFRAFNGLSHKVFEPGEFIESNWSEKPLTIEEVELFLGKVSK